VWRRAHCESGSEVSPRHFESTMLGRRALAANTIPFHSHQAHHHSANSEHLGVTVSASLNFRSFKTETRPNAFTKLSKHSPAPQTSVGSCARTMEFSRASTSVIIVGGGGTIGSSTALHLVRSGYTPSNITVLDTYPIPSAQSAGNDLNKVMGIRLRNKVDLQLSLEARQMWSEDDLFKEFFHKTGRVSSIK
jgi:hypothetical protein